MAEDEIRNQDKEQRIKRAERAAMIIGNIMALDRNPNADNYKVDRATRVRILTDKEKMGVNSEWIGSAAEPLVRELARQETYKPKVKDSVWETVDLSKAPNDPVNVEAINALRDKQEEASRRSAGNESVRTTATTSTERNAQQQSSQYGMYGDFNAWLDGYFGGPRWDAMFDMMGFGERFADLVFGRAVPKPKTRREEPVKTNSDLHRKVEEEKKRRAEVEREVARQQERQELERELKQFAIKGQAEVSRVTTAVYSPMGLANAEECMTLVRTISKDRFWMSGPAQTSQALHMLDQLADNPDYVDNPSFEGRARNEWKKNHRGLGDPEFDLFWRQAKRMITDIAIARFLDKRGALPNWKEAEMTGDALEKQWMDKHGAVRLAAIDRWNEIQGQIKKPEDASKYWWVERWQRQ